MTTRSDRIKNWANELTADQMRPLLVELVDFSIDAEMVGFHELAPYWNNTGEPLIEGQKTFED